MHLYALWVRLATATLLLLETTALALGAQEAACPTFTRYKSVVVTSVWSKTSTYAWKTSIPSPLAATKTITVTLISTTWASDTVLVEGTTVTEMRALDNTHTPTLDVPAVTQTRAYPIPDAVLVWTVLTIPLCTTTDTISLSEGPEATSTKTYSIPNAIRSARSSSTSTVYYDPSTHVFEYIMHEFPEKTRTWHRTTTVWTDKATATFATTPTSIVWAPKSTITQTTTWSTFCAAYGC